MSQGALDRAWRRQRTWSKAANRAKARIVNTRIVTLTLAVFGAFLATLAIELPKGAAQQWAAFIGTGSLALIPVLSGRFLSRDRAKAWIRARSVSEALKAEIYTHVARAAPYSGDEAPADKTLSERTEEIEESVSDLIGLTAGIEPDEKEPPDRLSPKDYIHERVMKQVNSFYRDKAGRYNRLAGGFRIAEFCLGIAATLLAAAAGAFGNPTHLFGSEISIGAWVAVITTIGGALGTHVMASRYDNLVTMYLATANRLESLAARAGRQDFQVPSDEWSTFVHECESAISVENESWMAEWSDKKPAKSSADPADDSV